MSDIALLGIGVNTSQVGDANVKLDQLAEKAAAAEAATGKLGQTARTSNDAMGGYRDIVDAINGQTAKLLTQLGLMTPAMQQQIQLTGQVAATHSTATAAVRAHAGAHQSLGAQMWQNRMVMMEL